MNVGTIKALDLGLLILNCMFYSLNLQNMYPQHSFSEPPSTSIYNMNTFARPFGVLPCSTGFLLM